MQQWMSLLAALHPISLSERVFKIWHFTGNLRIAFGRKDTMWTVRGLYHAVWNFSKDIYVSKEGCKILRQQWLSLLVTLYPISLAERVFQIWHFARKLRVVFGRKDTMWTVRGLYHAVWNFSKDIYVSKEGYEILQQQWVSLLVTLHPITSCWEGVQNLIFCTKIETCFWQKWHSLDPKYCVLCYTKLV